MSDKFLYPRTTLKVLARSPSPATIAATPATVGTHPSHGTTGKLNPLVDKMVGSSYDVVRECVTNLEYIKHVSAHLEQIYQVAEHVNEDGSFIFTPPAVTNPVNNGEMVFELTSNTQLKIKVKGSDGIIRKVILTLTP